MLFSIPKPTILDGITYERELHDHLPVSSGDDSKNSPSDFKLSNTKEQRWTIFIAGLERRR